MQSLELLRERVESGSLRLISIVGVPRSMSTALGRALNETEENSVFINEPFNRENKSINQAAAFILDHVVERSDQPPVVVVKNMASYIDTTSFAHIESLSVISLIAIRHPLRQIGSLLTRVVNDITQSPGSTMIKQDDIYPHLEKAEQFLINSEKSSNFSKTGWGSILTHLSIAPNAPRISIDGEVFTTEPEKTLRPICTTADLPYSNRMISGWDNLFINVINHGNEYETQRSAWTAHATKSDAIQKVERKDLDLKRTPALLRKHIEEVAIPAYEEIKTTYSPPVK